MSFKISRTENIRNFVFGVEDSLVSTVGLVSGIAAGGVSKSIIILTGVVLIFVEAFSMGIGTLLSDNSVKEFKTHSSVSLINSSISSLVMFFSYFLSGFIVLAPYFFLKESSAIFFSISLSLISLFLLGVLSAYFSGTSLFKKGFVMATAGGFAILIGVLVSIFFK